MTNTPLDQAHAAMTNAPNDDTARLKFFERLADSELVLMLDSKSETDAPILFDTSDGSFVLAFDTEDRLTTFAEAPAPYAALSGRALAIMLAGKSVGIALNPDVAPSSMLIPPDAIDWLHRLLDDAPKQQHKIPTEVRTPKVPERLIESLDGKLASAAGLANHAWLADVSYEDGTGLLLAIFGAAPGAETALAQAISEAVVFSGFETGILDVAFFDIDDAVGDRLARVGLRIDLPKPEQPKPITPDPNTPPRLR